MTDSVSCTICNDQGFTLVEKDGQRAMRTCRCQQEREIRWRVARSGIPQGYELATFDSFQTRPHTKNALMRARWFADNFFPGRGADGLQGLLFTGSVGTGKTHLAIAILRCVIEERAASGIFVDTRDMLARLRASYGADAKETEHGILEPLFKTDIVVLDELGAVRPSDWAFEMTELVIGKLYSQQKAVIITTNFPNAPVGSSTSPGQGDYSRAVRIETLGDRIGARMWSRLQQMCGTVEMNGPDFRLEARR